MSDIEAKKGKIRLVPTLGAETMEELCERIAKENDYENDYQNDSCYDTYLEYFTDEADKFIVVDGSLYELVQVTDFDYNQMIEAYPQDDGTIDFITVWYNGGAGFQEVLEEAVTKALNPKSE